MSSFSGKKETLYLCISSVYDAWSSNLLIDQRFSPGPLLLANTRPRTSDRQERNFPRSPLVLARCPEEDSAGGALDQTDGASDDPPSKTGRGRVRGLCRVSEKDQGLGQGLCRGVTGTGLTWTVRWGCLLLGGFLHFQRGRGSWTGQGLGRHSGHRSRRGHRLWGVMVLWNHHSHHGGGCRIGTARRWGQGLRARFQGLGMGMCAGGRRFRPHRGAGHGRGRRWGGTWKRKGRGRSPPRGDQNDDRRPPTAAGGRGRRRRRSARRASGTRRVPRRRAARRKCHHPRKRF
jgi:hypothetical protein